MTWFEHGVAMVLGVVLPGLAALRSRRIPEQSVEDLGGEQKIAIYWSNGAFVGLLTCLALAAAWYGGRSWRDLALVFPGENVGLGMVLGAMGLILFAADAMLQLQPERLAATRDRWRRDTPFMPASAKELRHSMVMVVSAAVGEEVLYRGFLIGYLVALMRPWRWSVVAAVLLPALVFAMSHAYQGLRSAVKIAGLSVLLGVIVVITGSIWIGVVFHFVIDLVGMMLGPRLMVTSD